MISNDWEGGIGLATCTQSQIPDKTLLYNDNGDECIAYGLVGENWR
jgi:hypothetical protein